MSLKSLFLISYVMYFLHKRRQCLANIHSFQNSCHIDTPWGPAQLHFKLTNKILIAGTFKISVQSVAIDVFFAPDDSFAFYIHENRVFSEEKIECPWDAIRLPLRCCATECTAPINWMFIFVGDAGQIISRDAETGAYGQRCRYEEAPSSHGETAPWNSRESSKIRGWIVQYAHAGKRAQFFHPIQSCSA